MEPRASRYSGASEMKAFLLRVGVGAVAGGLVAIAVGCVDAILHTSKYQFVELGSLLGLVTVAINFWFARKKKPN
jgi:hypothetical protein